MKLNIYSEQKKLIPRKLIGGLIPKFQNSGQFRRLGTTNYYQDRKTNKVYIHKNDLYTLITKPITISNLFETVAYSPNGEKAHSYRGLLRGANTYRTSELVALARLPKLSETNLHWKTTPKGTKYLDYGDGTFSLAGSSKRYRYEDYRKKPTTQNSETQGKPTETQGNDTRGIGVRGNARTIDKPTTTTFTESPINITNQSLINARNNAIQRGWRDYFYNGKRYSLEGSDLKQARKNWNINKGRLPRKTQNSFNPGQVLQESTLNSNALKQEIAPIKADFGYGVTESDLKTQYPSTISDEIKNFRLEPIIQNL